ncbi:hypothetical protein Bbelb_080440 [Branchiostoma belcheri]|nr:hypothetical protein Bbelb_080440 [Branchiostoma belcheri]
MVWNYLLNIFLSPTFVLVYVSSVNYLGNQITTNLSDDESIRTHIRRFYTRANSLVRKFKFASTEVKRTLFNAYCSSMYCAQLWTRYTLGAIRKLRTAYNNAFRILFSYGKFESASRMFVTEVVDTFDARRRKLTHSFTNRLLNSNNRIIKLAIHSDLSSTSHYWDHYIGLVYRYATWPYKTFQKLGIPGPPPLPLIGNLIDYKKGLSNIDLEWMKKYGKYWGVYEGQLPVLIVADTKLIKQINVKEFPNFANRRLSYLSCRWPSNTCSISGYLGSRCT